MARKKGYEFFDHTADVGISVFGEDLNELFSNSAKGMFEVIGGGSNFNGEVAKTLIIQAEDLTGLLHKWLSELLYLFETEKLFMVDFEIIEIGLNRLKAKLRGQSYMGQENLLEREIKAVTLHGLEIKQECSGWSARVIFDI